VTDPNGGAKLVRLNLDGSLDAAFHGPVTGGSFNTTSNILTLPQPNGKIVFYGDGLLQRLNPDGTADPSFASVHITTNSATGPPTAPRIIVQADGSYLLYGYFDAVNGVPRRSIARVTAGGVLDAAFDPGSKSVGFERFKGAVLQPDQKILLYGDFTSYPGTTSNCLIRVLPNGDLDPTFKDVQFTLAASKPVIYNVTVQPDGRIVIVGYFTGVNGAARGYMARLNPDGSVDNSFDPGANLTNDSYGQPSVLLQPDGKLILYGSFKHDGPNLMRLNADGSRDSSFASSTGAPGWADAVPHVELLPNGQLLVLGGFNPGTRNGFARLNSNGTLDQTYNPAAKLYEVQGTGAQAIVPTSDGKLLVAGGVLKTGAGYVYDSIERLNNDGSVDTTFNPGTGPYAGYGGYNGIAFVSAIAIQPDGKIIAGGYFYSFNGVNRGGIVRLETNGSVDPTFNPGDTSQTNIPRTLAIAIAPNGQIYASGKFAGQAQEDSLARINQDGTLDSTFHPARIALNGFGPVATSIAVQPDGKPVFLFAPNGGTSNPSALARFNLDGSLDATFASGASTPGIIHLAGTGRSVRVQPDGKIVLGGAFTPNTDGAVAVTHANLERFNADGTRDSTFNSGGSGLSSDVNDVFLEPNGSIVIGGNFTYVNGIVRRGVAVLKPNGDVNENIDPGDGPDNKVTGIAAQADGKLVLTGPFTNVAGVPKAGIARLLVPSGQMLNLSTRTQVLAGENVLITGFIVTGNAPKKVLLRGIGPSLPMTGQLNDPVLELFDGTGISIAKNDDWRESQ